MKKILKNLKILTIYRENIYKNFSQIISDLRMFEFHKKFEKIDDRQGKYFTEFFINCRRFSDFMRNSVMRNIIQHKFFE